MRAHARSVLLSSMGACKNGGRGGGAPCQDIQNYCYCFSISSHHLCGMQFTIQKHECTAFLSLESPSHHTPRGVGGGCYQLIHWAPPYAMSARMPATTASHTFCTSRPSQPTQQTPSSPPPPAHLIQPQYAAPGIVPPLHHHHMRPHRLRRVSGVLCVVRLRGKPRALTHEPNAAHFGLVTHCSRPASAVQGHRGVGTWRMRAGSWARSCDLQCKAGVEVAA